MRIRIPDAIFVGGSGNADFIGQAAVDEDIFARTLHSNASLVAPLDGVSTDAVISSHLAVATEDVDDMVLLRCRAGAEREAPALALSFSSLTLTFFEVDE